MDPARSLDLKLKPNAWDIATQSLTAMCTRWRMASMWTDALQKVHAYLHQKREEWKDAGGSPGSTSSDGGFGLKDYSADFEKAQKEFGSFENTRVTSNTVDRIPIKSLCGRDSEDRTEVLSPAMTFKSEKRELSEDRSTATPAPSASFTPVNGNVKPAATTPTTETLSGSDHSSQMNGPQIFDHGTAISSSQTYSTSYSPTVRSGYPHVNLRPTESSQYQGQNLQNHIENAHVPGADQSHYPGFTRDPEQLRNLVAQGSSSIDRSDFTLFQAGTSFLGQTFNFIDPMYNNNTSWYPHIFQLWNTDGDPGQSQDHLPQGQYTSGQTSQGQLPQY